MKLGIVGLPNAGKTTLFNAMTRASAKVDSYPFTTIEPNVGYAVLEDERLTNIYKVIGGVEIRNPSVKVVDIAGLVEGAHKGEGLGNKFLAYIREMDGLIFVLDCFSDENKPLDDFNILKTELMLSDIEILERKKDRLLKGAKGKKDKKIDECIEIIEKSIKHLNEGGEIKDFLNKEEMSNIEGFDLLTSKSYILVLNIKPEDLSEKEIENRMAKIVCEKKERCILISCLLEEEVSKLEGDEKLNILNLYNLERTMIKDLIEICLHILDLIIFYTIESGIIQGWTLKNGENARRAAGRIHRDMEEGFIKAEVISYNDLMNIKDIKKIREMGRLKIEGGGYIVEDGDIMRFLFRS
ncbi:MAG: redox-regulated ATPase YchF [bacterium]